MNVSFSIIMCTYNGGIRINDVVNSVINQKEYDTLITEFIIVDNNSNEETKQIIRNNAKKDSKIKIVEERKQGLGNARLRGIQNSISNWIIFIDDDNILHDSWIIYAKDYIFKNKNIGAFNGAVVPLIKEKLSEQEKIILKNVIQGLACTHCSLSEILKDEKKHPYRIPFGAGLVIISKPLKELAENGWLMSNGRTSDNLMSCEDTEMCLYVKSKGYKFGYNYKMVISHLISPERLRWSYLEKLWNGFADGNYKLIINSRFGKIKSYIYLVLLSVRCLIYKIKLNNDNIVIFKLKKIYMKRYLNRMRE